MGDRLDLAKRIAQEKLAERDDILGVLVYGSVARGEATETSDIDLAVFAARVAEGKGDLSCWREGVYVDAGLHTMEKLGSFEDVMGNPIDATHMNYGLILHDPTGFFGRLQEQVRRAFMEPRWLRARVDWELELYRSSLAGLRGAIGGADPFGICRNAMRIPHAASAVPLFMAGVAVSSTRHLLQLAEVDPSIRSDIVEFECALPLSRAELAALLRVCASYHPLLEGGVWGGLPCYGTRKAEHMAEHGQLAEALDLLWFSMGLCDAVDQKREEAHTLAEQWLSGVGWRGAASLGSKLELAEALLQKVEAMGAALPRSTDVGDAHA